MRHLVKIPLKSPHPQIQPFTFLIIYQSLPYVTKKPTKWKFTSPYKSSLIVVVNILQLDLFLLRLCMVFNLEQLSMYVLHEIMLKLLKIELFMWITICILVPCKKVFLHLPPNFKYFSYE